MAELIPLKFIVKFVHCPRSTLSFHSTKFSLSLKGFKWCAQKTEVVEVD